MKTDKVKEGAGKNPKWCKSSHSAPPTSRLVPNQSRNNDYFGKTKPTAFIAEHDVIRNELSCWSAVLFMFLPTCCPSPACLWWDGAQRGNKQALFNHSWNVVAVTNVKHSPIWVFVTLSQQDLMPITLKSHNYCSSSAVLELLLFELIVLVWRITVHSVSSVVGLKGKLVHHLTCISHLFLLDSIIPGVQKIWIRTWGCSHNNSDGEYMAGQLAAYGYKITGNSMSEPSQFFWGECSELPSCHQMFSVLIMLLKVPFWSFSDAFLIWRWGGKVFPWH